MRYAKEPQKKSDYILKLIKIGRKEKMQQKQKKKEREREAILGLGHTKYKYWVNVWKGKFVIKTKLLINFAWSYVLPVVET